MNEENGIDIQTLLKILLKRKKLFLSIFFLFFLTGSSLLIFLRIFRPLYKGSFSLLMQIPLKKIILVIPRLDLISIH